MPYVNFPPGMRSLAFTDGLPPATASREGGRVELSDERARAVDAMTGNGDAGLVTARFRSYGGTKRGRVCSCSPTIWNAWTTQCPKCKSLTLPE